MGRKKSKTPKKRPDKRRKKRPKLKGMTKSQIKEIGDQLKSSLQKKSEVLVDSIKTQCKSEVHISSDAKRQRLLDEICNVGTIKVLSEKYCALYTENSKGHFDDKYALFQVSWVSWIGTLLSSQIKAVFSETCEASADDKSAVLHSIGSAFSKECTDIIQKFKPSFNNQPVVKESVTYDNKDAVIAFSGACLRIIRKKSIKRKKQPLIDLINFLKMTKQHREKFVEWGIMPTALMGLWTIPVSPMHSYVTLINRVLQENLTSENFSTFGNTLIKVSTLVKKSLEFGMNVIGKEKTISALIYNNGPFLAQTPPLLS